jgi:hypothetical protein
VTWLPRVKNYCTISLYCRILEVRESLDSSASSSGASSLLSSSSSSPGLTFARSVVSDGNTAQTSGESNLGGPASPQTFYSAEPLLQSCEAQTHGAAPWSTASCFLCQFELPSLHASYESTSYRRLHSKSECVIACETTGMLMVWRVHASISFLNAMFL